MILPRMIISAQKKTPSVNWGFEKLEQFARVLKECMKQ